MSEPTKEAIEEAGSHFVTIGTPSESWASVGMDGKLTAWDEAKCDTLSVMTRFDFIKKALQQAGGSEAVAIHMQMNHRSAVHRWIKRGIPAHRAKQLCAMKGVTVTAKQMRPDVF